MYVDVKVYEDSIPFVLLLKAYDFRLYQCTTATLSTPYCMEKYTVPLSLINRMLVQNSNNTVVMVEILVATAELIQFTYTISAFHLNTTPSRRSLVYSI